MPKFRLAINGREREFEVSRQGDRLHVSSEAGEVDVHVRQAGDVIVLELDDGGPVTQRLRMAGVRQRDERQVWVDGRMLKVARLRRQETAVATGGGSLAATIPATVSDILVSAGDTVEAGDKLVLLESMKMIIPIAAPAAGTITAVHCEVGQSVAAGFDLVELEAHE